MASYPVCCDWPNEYLKRVMEMLRPSSYHDAVSQHDDSKTIKHIIKEAFVASSGDIITGYNDLYCHYCTVLFNAWLASRHVNISMSAFVIGEMSNNKCYSTILKTRV